jgi:Mrp family chromosome partitioning ATPase
MLRVQLTLGKRGRVIMVTSAGAGDGKTTVAAALAAAFAEVNDDVVLMDLDMRRPELTRLLGPSPTVDGHGRAELANGAADGTVPVRPLPGVKLVPAPRGDLAKLETIIKTLPAQINQAKRKGACVIIDTAPVGEVSEALRIASVSDQVVVVARPRHTDRRRLRMARDLLERAHAPTVGMVLVAEDESVSSDYGYGYSTGLGSMLDDNGVQDAEVQAVSSEKVRGIEPG